KRNDTIDVWIDSGVSHRAVCAAHPELRDPADIYLEATDQHRGWFQSSLMTSIALNDRAPYKMCLTHGFVVDLDGKKISKSGTYDKPMDAGHFVKRHGADLIRLWASSINFGDDVPFSEEMFTRLGDTYRRIRNTLRILLGNLFDFAAADTVRRPGSPTPAASSVHLELFLKTDDRARDSAASQQIDQLLRLRGVIGQALEKARQEKLIGNSLEARVTLKCDRKLIGAIAKEELEEFFILSDLIIEDATEPSATVEKTPFAKCARCWRHRESVGQSSAHPD